MAVDELRELLSRHARSALSNPMPDVLIFKAEAPFPPRPATYGKVLALVAQGVKRVAIGDRVLEYGAGECLVASVDVPVMGNFAVASRRQPGLGIGLTLRPAEIADVMLQADPADLPSEGDDAPSALAVSTASDELVDAIVRLVRLLDQPRDVKMLAPLIKREILWRLITGDQGAVVRQFGLPDSSLSHIARVVVWIREHYTESFRVEDLARLASMSVSAFHRNFQAVTAMSPIQFQKQIRLQQARVYLASELDDVGGISRRVGYDSASQFSREYRRQFGVTPSQDAARVRSATVG
jgi:AraC-like DNA-binding protein